MIALVRLLGIAGAWLTVSCGSASTELSYLPTELHQFPMPAHLGNSGEHMPIVEVRVPTGFKPLYPQRVSIYERWERTNDPLELTMDTYASSPEGWIGEPRPSDLCSRDLVHGESKDAAIKRIVHEVGDDHELVLCEFEALRPDGRRGPEGYIVRKWIHIGNHWLECKAVMRGRRSNPDGRWFYDGDSWTARQRADVLDICRSFRVVRTEPFEPLETPDQADR